MSGSTPHLRQLLARERRCMALVRRCNDILHEADVAAVKGPLESERVSHFLRQVCAAVAEAIQCADVAVYLREPDAPDHAYPLVASTTGAAPGTAVVVLRGVGPVGVAIDEGRPEITAEMPLMAVPIISGDAVWGAIVCGGPGLNFDRYDLAALTPVTPQLARYWHTWLQRRTISEENESWRLLAAGLTSFDELLSEQLAGGADPDGGGLVYETAVDVVRGVVPHCRGGEVWRPADRGGPLVRSSPPGRDPPTSRMTLAYRSPDQWVTTDPDDIAAEGARAGTGWLVYTPLRVGRRRYGLFTASGDSAALPLNAPRVCKIIGGQLGLYLHLRQTLRKLQETQATLDSTVISQADALEDLEHQLVSPLLAATSRTERLLADNRNPDSRGPDSRADPQLRAIRGLCRKSGRVAMSAGVFAALSKGQTPRPKLELLSADDLLRLLIAGADDAQLLSNPRLGIEFTVDRDAVRALGRRLIEADRAFVEQCVGNLLDNAAKYSYRDTRVDIGGRIDGDTFAIAVTNVGLALDAVEAELCLRRNWRGAAARGVTGEGSGIGLWIVDHLMRCMKGRVSLASTAAGTTASLTFPLRLTPGSRP